VAVIAHRFEPFLRASIVQGLQDRFRTRVELSSFHVAPGNGIHVRWGVWATGRGLRIWPPQRAGGDHPLETAVQSVPLIALEEFSFHVPFSWDSRAWMHISQVRLQGLDIHVPPKSERRGGDGIEAATRPTSSSTAGTVQGGSGAANARNSATQPGGGMVLSNLVIDRIDCEHGQLVLETDKPDKLPLGFAISHLHLTHVTSGGPMGFETDLTNPKPEGVIHATGSFGPWIATDPGESAVSGAYRFEHADLSSFKGIAGILFSTGHFQGTLRNIDVQGEANVPDFRLSHFGNPMPLHTQFHARVDGTDGDTWLNPVDATLGRSHFTTEGHVVRVKTRAAGPLPVSELGRAAPFEGGHLIDLKVNVDRGHIEDFLRLATHSQTPLLTGDVGVRATLHIPPGKEPVHERIKLDGSFRLAQAHFTSDKIQGRIEDLSLRGQGKPGDVKKVDPNTVTSAMQGTFHMLNAVITLPDLQYDVPGAAIRLSGTYALDGMLDFSGTARMHATVSQMVGGWRGILLKPADRFFKKDGAGTLVPIKIRGTRESPEFGLDLGGVKSTKPQSPAGKH
jgi:hypothetical protein